VVHTAATAAIQGEDVVGRELPAGRNDLGRCARLPADAIIAFQRAEREGTPVLAIDAEPVAGRLLPHRREDHPALPAVRVFEGAFGAIHAAALNQFNVIPIVESGEVPEQELLGLARLRRRSRRLAGERLLGQRGGYARRHRSAQE